MAARLVLAAWGERPLADWEKASRVGHTADRFNTGRHTGLRPGHGLVSPSEREELAGGFIIPDSPHDGGVAWDGERLKEWMKQPHMQRTRPEGIYADAPRNHQGQLNHETELGYGGGGAF